MVGLARMASRARFCLFESGWNSASSVKSTARSSTSCGRSFAVAVPYWSSIFGLLDVEAKMNHVAVAHHVLLALEAELARLLGALLPTVRDEVVVRGDLGTDEAALEVGVNHAGGLRRGGATRNRPRAHFLRTGGEIGLQAEESVGCPDHAI